MLDVLFQYLWIYCRLHCSLATFDFVHIIYQLSISNFYWFTFYRMRWLVNKYEIFAGIKVKFPFHVVPTIKQRKKKSKSGHKARLFAYNCHAVTHNDFRPNKIRTEYCSVVGDLLQENSEKNYGMKRFSFWKILQSSFIVVKYILNSDLHNSLVNACRIYQL